MRGLFSLLVWRCFFLVAGACVSDLRMAPTGQSSRGTLAANTVFTRHIHSHDAVEFKMQLAVLASSAGLLAVAILTMLSAFRDVADTPTSYLTGLLHGVLFCAIISNVWSLLRMGSGQALGSNLPQDNTQLGEALPTGAKQALQCATPRSLVKECISLSNEKECPAPPTAAPAVEYSIDEFESIRKQRAVESREPRSVRRSTRTPKRYGQD